MIYQFKFDKKNARISHQEGAQYVTIEVDVPMNELELYEITQKIEDLQLPTKDIRALLEGLETAADEIQLRSLMASGLVRGRRVG